MNEDDCDDCDCNDDGEDFYGEDFESGRGDDCDFADPGGRSALRAESERNPRNLPCPSCGAEDVLTPADVARGYQCDSCADACERGGP